MAVSLRRREQPGRDPGEKECADENAKPSDPEKTSVDPKAHFRRREGWGLRIASGREGPDRGSRCRRTHA